jgi:hypothetical protein
VELVGSVQIAEAPVTSVDNARKISVSNTIQDHSALKEQFHAYDRYLFCNFRFIAENGQSVQVRWILQRRNSPAPQASASNVLLGLSGQ